MDRVRIPVEEVSEASVLEVRYILERFISVSAWAAVIISFASSSNDASRSCLWSRELSQERLLRHSSTAKLLCLEVDSYLPF